MISYLCNSKSLYNTDKGRACFFGSTHEIITYLISDFEFTQNSKLSQLSSVLYLLLNSDITLFNFLGSSPCLYNCSRSS